MLSTLYLSARTESALHDCVYVYTLCTVSDSTSDETYTNALPIWLTLLVVGSLRPNHELPRHSGLPASVESIGSDLYPIPSLSTKYSNSAGTSKPHQNWVSRILVSDNIRTFS